MCNETIENTNMMTLMMYWIEADVYIILYYIIYKSITVTLISS